MEKYFKIIGLLFIFSIFAAASESVKECSSDISELRRKYTAGIGLMSSKFLDDREKAIREFISEAEGKQAEMMQLMMHLLTDESWYVQSSAAAVLKQMGTKAAPVKDKLAGLMILAVRKSDWGLYSLAEGIFLSLGSSNRETVLLIAEKADAVTGNMGRSLQQFLEKLKGGVNEPPVIQPEPLKAVEGKPFTFTVRITDPDDISCFLKAEVTEKPGKGTLEPEGPGTFTYTPPLGSQGEISFTCRATDFSGTQGKPCTVTIQVKPDYGPPVIEQVLAAGIATQLIITFSKPMNPGTASDSSLYSVNPGIKVQKALPLEEPEKVRLTVTEMKEGVEYSLAVNGVTDTSSVGNPCTGTQTFSFSSAAPGIMCAKYDCREEAPKTPEEFENLKPVKQGIVKRLTLSLVHSEFDSNGNAVVNGQMTQDHENTYFAMLFTGFIAIAKEGVYTFYIKADDGGRLFIDGIKIAAENTKGTVNLKPGLHRLCFIYSQGSWGYGLKVEYEGPGIKRQEIPGTILLNAGDGSGDTALKSGKKELEAQEPFQEEPSEECFEGGG